MDIRSLFEKPVQPRNRGPANERPQRALARRHAVPLRHERLPARLHLRRVLVAYVITPKAP